MRIAHISDLHVACFPCNLLNFFSKRIFAVLNHFLFRKQKYSFKIFDAFLTLLKENPVDLLIVTGDLTTSSLTAEFIQAKKLLDSTKIPYIVIPGNHDKYTKNADRFQRFFSHFSNPEPTFGCLKNIKVQANQIQKDLFIVALDTALATNLFSSRGLFSENLERSLLEILEKIPKTAKIILLNHYPLFTHEKESRTLKGAERLENILKNFPNVILYLHGHTHRHCMVDLRKANLPIILDSGSISKIDKGSCNFIDIGEKSCQISVYYFRSGWEKAIQKEYLWNLQ